MSVTEELRRLLDERGVEWKDGDAAFEIEWSTPDGRHCSAMYWKPTFSVLISGCTPEQAIAATLGDGDYKQAADYWKGMYEELLTERIGEERDYLEHDGRYECPYCGNVVYYDELHGGGWTIYVEDYQIPFNHCPNCGRKVKR